MEKVLEQYQKAAVKRLQALEATGILRHLLSPLENAAYQNQFKPFQYPIHNHDLYISGWGCKELLESCMHKLRLLEQLEYYDRQCADIPLKHREEFFDPRVILSLHPQLRNCLCKLSCYNLFTVMKKGRTFFEKEQKFTKKSLKIIQNLFDSMACGNLFR